MPNPNDILNTASALPPLLAGGLATSTIDGGALGAIVCGAVGWVRGGTDKAQKWFVLGGIIGGAVGAAMYATDLLARVHS